MNFTSHAFAAFCLFTIPAYFLLARSVSARNAFLLAASYLFYGWWDWRFLALIAATCLIDFKVAAAIDDAQAPRRKRRLLWVSLASNLGVLGFFKYFNFFLSNAERLLGAIGIHASQGTLSLLLPVGISFYTFQSIAYVVDVYRGRIRAERDPLVFFTFVAFFPQLAAGPIERAEHMLPQFRALHFPSVQDIGNGVWLVVYGYFTKMVVADTLAPWVDANFQANQTLGWSTVLSTLAFGLQIYGDFKGYSLIAKGLAALLGFELVWNFEFPYWSTSVQEFWHRWHISLSTWLRDYLYIPLGGSRAKPGRVYLNLMATMVLGGLWHGAGWNFLLWGAWHGAALCTQRMCRRLFTGKVPAVLGSAATLGVVFTGWFFFRATQAPVAIAMIRSLGNLRWLEVHTALLRVLVLVGLPMFLLEWYERRRGANQLALADLNLVARTALVGCMGLFIFAASQRPAVDFIYFHF